MGRKLCGCIRRSTACSYSCQWSPRTSPLGGASGFSTAVRKLVNSSCGMRPDLGQISAYLAGAVDGVEGLAEVAGQRVRSGDRVLSGLDLNGAVAAGGLDEFPD